MTAVSRRSAVALLTAGLSLAACSLPGSGATSQPGSGSPSDSEGSASPEPSSVPDGEQEGTSIRIRIGNRTVEASVWGNPTGQALLARLPLTLDFKDFNSVEKVGRLDGELPVEGVPAGDDPEVGDLGYYAPWGNIILYYGDVGYWDGIVRIGRIHGDLSTVSGQVEDFTATLEPAG